jgi:hypothetical protein
MGITMRGGILQPEDMWLNYAKMGLEEINLEVD